MKNSADLLDRKSLSAIYAQSSQPEVRKLALFSKLNRILQYLMQVFVGSNDLRIWQAYDRFGNNWWHAYDPLTGRCTTVESEAEMRSWIERHYYR